MSENNDVDFTARDPLAGVEPLFTRRWSPRAFTPAPVDEHILARLIDAARWSPSCFNEQPWRFYTSNAATFQDYLGLLIEGNQVWARHSSVIGFMVGRTRFGHNGNPNDWSAFDCGAAWMAMTLQARTEGLYTHGMAGIHKNEAADYLRIDTENEAVIMGFAIGRLGDKAALPEALQAKEKPSPRKPLAEIWNPARDPS